MSSIDSLISTKLIPPVCNGELVYRQRLLDKLGTNPQSVSLVCAPAGFGKTTLLTAWLEQQQKPLAWLSLDENDNDPARFLLYLIASIQKIHPEIGQQESAILALPQVPNVLSLLRSLINQINTISEHFFLAFDDYHVIENDIIHEALDFLIAHLPQTLNIAITSRTFPPIALPRLRVRRQLAEITESDLRFTQNEATEFLNKITGLNLSNSDIEILEARTEGWIAGLQLAAISLEDEENKTAFIQAFAGDDRYIMDYLTDEVLRRQTNEIKQFLLQTSILNRLSAPLCDKLTGHNNSAEILEQLERSNMFVIPLDKKRHWYRYHHLFSDLLREQLNRSLPEQLAILHRNASEWFNENNFPRDAIKHAFEVDDFEQVSAVLHLHGQQLFEEGQITDLMLWYDLLPDAIVNSNPHHMLRRAWTHFLGCGEVLTELVEQLQQLFDSDSLLISNDERLALQADLALMGGFRSMQQRNILEAKKYATAAMQFSEAAGNRDSIPPRLLTASACYAQGELDLAGELFRILVNDSFSNQYLITLNGSICGLSRVLTKQGRLKAAQDELITGLERMKEKGWDEYLMDTAWIYLALSELAYCTNNLDDCLQHLDDADIAAYRDTWNTLPAIIKVRRASVMIAKGDLEIARNNIAEIKKIDIKLALLPFFPNVVDDLIAIQLKLNDMSMVDQWLADNNLDINNKPLPEQEWQNILFVRILLQKNKPEQAFTLLTQLLLIAEQNNHQLAVVELLIFQALARQKMGKIQQAVQSLEQALGYAASENYSRVFIDEGAAIQALLKHAVNGSQTEYATKILNLISDEPISIANSKLHQEPLSTKEQKTLDLLVTGLSNKEIAEQLFVSTNTIKTHLKNIYKKLDVSNRVEAVAKARQ